MKFNGTMKKRFVKRQDKEAIRCCSRMIKEIKGLHDIYWWRVTGKRNYYGCSLSESWAALDASDKELT
jgi:hypothetical protein